MSGKFFHHAVTISIAAAIFLAVTGRLAAQTASLSGTVMDSSGAIVPRAAITATDQQRSLTFTAISGEGGSYTLLNLPVGSYSIQAEATGFKRFIQTGIELTVGMRGLLNIIFQVGDVAERVEVSGEASRVDVQTATIQQLVDARRVVDLPLNGRNIYDLAKLVPGTGAGGMNFNGSRGPEGSNGGTSINIRLDGALHTEMEYQRVLPAPSPDGVQEFSIQTSLPSAKYAFAAGVIEIVTKSGTNQMHGTAYDFLRNDKLDARNFFSPTKTKRRRNQFGGSAGGPLVLPHLYDGRNRTFWFTSVEKQYEPLGRVTTIFVPTAEQRQGDFSRFAQTIRDPLTNQPFAGNRIPASRLDSIATGLQEQLVPTAQEANGRYTYQQAADNSPLQILARGDHTLKSNQFSYRLFLTRLSAPYALSTLPYFTEGVTKTATTSNTFNYTKTINSRAINLFRFSKNAFEMKRDSSKYATFTPDKLRALGWRNFYNYTNYLPALALSGYFSVSGTFPETVEPSDTFTWEDDLSLHRGKHTLYLGMRAMRSYNYHDPLVVRRMGSYSFNGQFSGSALSDFMLGKPFFFEQQNEQTAHEQQTQLAWYIQDEMKLTRRLNVNLGLRYELPFAAVDADGRAMVFRPQSGQRSTVFKNAPPGLLFQGDQGVGGSARETYKKSFGPRLGVVYALTADQKTVLRAGYGLMYNQTWLNLEAQYTNKQPWVNRISVRPPDSTSDPWATFPGGNPFPSPSGNPDFVFRNAQIWSMADGYRDPAFHQWNLNLQREFGSYLVTAAYVGTRGTHLPFVTDYNYARYIPGQSTAVNLDSRRPYYEPLTIIEWGESSGNSSYHSAQFSMQKRFSRGVSVMGSYTFSKALDDQSENWTAYLQNPDSRAAEWGPAIFDRTHAAVASWIWELPRFWQRTAVGRQVFGGWSTTGILTMYSGSPLRFAVTQDRALRGLANRPDRLRDARLDVDRPRQEYLTRYFDTGAYVPNGTGQFGSAPRTESQLRGPGIVNFDFGVLKGFRITEGHRVDFRAEIFNLPNRPNFGSPGTNVDTPGSLGRIVSAADGRIIQFALKYVF